MRCVGNDIFKFGLEQSLSRSERTYRAYILQRKRKPEAALDAGITNMELAQLKIQTVAMRIIANLDGRALENRMLGIIGNRESRAESGFRRIAVRDDRP